MPTTAWSVMRPEISRELGFFGFTSDTITTTTVVSAPLENEFDEDDYFIGWYVLIEAGDNAGLHRRISDYAANGGTLTHKGVNLTADSTDRSCSLYRYHPVRLREQFNRARQDMFPGTCIVRDTRTVITGQHQHRYTLPTTLREKPIRVYLGNRAEASAIAKNLVTDPGFEDWTNATTLASWTLAGTNATANQEQEQTNPRNYMVLEGSNSCRLYSASSGTATVTQVVTPTVAAEGVEFNASVWAYCRTASRVRLILNSSGASATYSGYHSGTGWEQLTATHTTVGTTAAVTVGVEVSAGTQIQAYIDELVMVAGQEEILDQAWTPTEDWLWLPPVAGASNGGSIEFRGLPPEQRRLRIVGRDMLSSVSADTDTVEIDGPMLAPLYDKTRELVARALSHEGPIGERTYWASEADRFGARVELELYKGHYAQMPNPRARIPDKVI
mgnify:FL=1